jgi:electron transport complex protein RnfB
MTDILIYTILTLVVLGVVAAIVLYFVAQKFKVEEDPRIDIVEGMLPGANCGGCGYPGCSGLAEALVEGKVKKVSTCRPSKPEARQNIKDYLASTPGPDGNTVNVDL